MSITELDETTAVVTGVSRGFGRAIATSLVGHGARVVGVARSKTDLDELHQQLGPVSFQWPQICPPTPAWRHG